MWFCLLSLEDRCYVNDQNAIKNRHREKFTNIETDVPDCNGGNLNQWQLVVQRNNKNSKKRREGIKTDVSDGNGGNLNKYQVDARSNNLKERLKSFPRLKRSVRCVVTRVRSVGSLFHASRKISLRWVERLGTKTPQKKSSQRGAKQKRG